MRFSGLVLDEITSAKITFTNFKGEVGKPNIKDYGEFVRGMQQMLFDDAPYLAYKLKSTTKH